MQAGMRCHREDPIEIAEERGYIARVKSFLKKIKLNEDTISMALGVLVIFVVGILLINYFRTVNKSTNKGEVSSTNTEVTALVSPTAKLTPISKPTSTSTPTPTVTPTKEVAKPTTKIEIKPTVKLEINPIGKTDSLTKGDYTIQAGDSLWKIAEKTYGDGYKWTSIYEANKEIIGANPSLIKVGVKISLAAVKESPVITYAVVTGDNLWNISVKTCNNGFVWPQIAADNKIANPQRIYPGQTLTIRCK